MAPSLSALTWEKSPLAGDKVGNLMPIRLAILYFSVKGVNLGATEFLVSEEELSQAC